MHLPRRLVAGAERRRGAGEAGLNVAEARQHLLARRRASDHVVERRQVRKTVGGPPGDLELARGANGLLLALGDDPDEVGAMDDLHEPGHRAHRVRVHRVDRGARGARAHDAAVQHTGHAHVLDIHVAPGHLRRNVHPRDRPTDDRVLRDALRRGALRDRAAPALAADQLGVGDAPRAATHDAIRHRELVHRDAETRRGQGQERLARLGGGLADRRSAELDRLAADRRPLVGRERGVPLDDRHARDRHVQLLGDDLRQRGLDARAELDLSRGERHATGLPKRTIFVLVGEMHAANARDLRRQDCVGQRF